MRIHSIAFAALATIAGTGVAQARDQVQIAGSSTVLPFANIAAEQFGKANPKFKTPVVESGGSSAGLKNFCAGIGEKTIDIANSSRKIRPAEIADCKKNGVADIIEVKFGYDGIVFASSTKSAKFAFEPKHIYLAVAAQVPVKGQLAANPYKNWKEIDPKLPDQPIQLFIPGEKHGTREVFEEKVLEAGCHDYPEIKALDAKAKANACKAVRKDGLSVDIDGDYTETLARIQRTETAIGVFGLSFYDQNRDKIQVAPVGGIEPTVESIADGKYPVSRPLYFYVKKAHVGVIPGLKEYVDYFLSDKMVGEEGMTVDKGLIPMPKAELQQVRQSVASGSVLSN
jgi:phosphate transport system substrate-binding protein